MPASACRLRMSRLNNFPVVLQRKKLEPFLFNCVTPFTCPFSDQHTVTKDPDPSFITVLHEANFSVEQIAALIKIKIRFRDDMACIRAERKRIQAQMRKVRYFAASSPLLHKPTLASLH